jgi:NAD(P)H dehydrogenase (quinone)
MMHAHFVLAHPEPQSFNAHLVRSGSAALEAEGWTVSVSDLYSMGFDPCERPEYFNDRAVPARFDVQAEQRHATDAGTLPKVVTSELALMDRADLLVLQYPMWWRLPPAMMKGWFDRVLAYGEAYTSKKRFEKGRFVGKRAILSVTVGTSRNTYEHDGRSGDIDLMLWPVNFSLAYVGYDVLAPFVAYGVEAGLRYSDPTAIEERLRAVVADYRKTLPRFGQRATIPFNRMEEWG